MTEIPPSPDSEHLDTDSPIVAPPLSPKMEEFLSGTFKRMQRAAIVFSVAAALLAFLFAGWRNGLALVLGASVAYFNFVWLHSSSEAMVQRMLAPKGNGPGKLSGTLLTLGRYAFLIAFTYVIFKGYPQVRVAVVVGLACPILASMCESIYEAIVLSKT